MILCNMPLTHVEKLLRNKVRVYQYVNGLHSKLMIVDDELVVVSSANMDIRSLELLFETNLFIYDKKVAQTVRDIYHTDMNNSKELNLCDWLQRNRSVKFHEEACFVCFLRYISCLSTTPKLSKTTVKLSEASSNNLPGGFMSISLSGS